jgi:HD superfamily phosphohydrolase
MISSAIDRICSYNSPVPETPLHYIDRIYGPATIVEPVLLALLDSLALQRLHGVLQHGISGLLGVTRATTRYEHSVGAMLLVRRFGASLDEQIAALLHDVSHTAFSHVIDYVFNDHDHQSYHEEKKEQFISSSDLPEVLNSFGFDWHDLLREDCYPLLEQPSPGLCADRLDYFLRDALDLGLATQGDLQNALAYLVKYQGRIVVDDLPAARWMAHTFIAADQASWANFREVGLYELTAQAIRYALSNGALSEADLWGGDREAWAKLKQSKDAILQAQLALVSPATQFVWDAEQPDFRVSTKLRTIDPDVLHNGSLRRLSELDPLFAASRQAYLRENSGKWPIRVIRSPLSG